MNTEHTIKSKLLNCLLAGLLCVSMFPLALLMQPGSAEAAALHRGVVEDNPRAASKGIVLDSDLHAKTPSFNVPISTSTHTDKESGHTVIRYDYALNLAAKTYKSLPTNITAKWTNVGFDADNDRIDLVVTWLSDSRWYATKARTLIPLVERYPTNPYGSAGITIGVDGVSDGNRTCCEQHVRYTFYKSGTTTPASGEFLTRFTDLDQPGWDDTYNDRWCESIEFVRGYGEMFVPSGNVLNIKANRNGDPNTDFWPTRKMDGSSLNAGVVTSLSNNSEFWFYDTRGFTDILDQYDPHTITMTSSTGGSVNCKG